MMVCQLSVENAIAKSAADTNEKIEAKQRVTALQKAILGLWWPLFPFFSPRMKYRGYLVLNSDRTTCGRTSEARPWAKSNRELCYGYGDRITGRWGFTTPLAYQPVKTWLAGQPFTLQQREPRSEAPLWASSPCQTPKASTMCTSS